jgi:hypothetical protein
MSERLMVVQTDRASQRLAEDVLARGCITVGVPETAVIR